MFFVIINFALREKINCKDALCCENNELGGCGWSSGFYYPGGRVNELGGPPSTPPPVGRIPGL